MIKKYYGRSIAALLLIPVAAMAAMALFEAMDPELARGHANYVRNFALLSQLRGDVFRATPVLLGGLWLLACHWLVLAKSRRPAWVWLALLGPAGFVVLMTLSDQSPARSPDALPNSPATPDDAYRRQLSRLNTPLRVLYEVVRLMALAALAMQLVEWFEDGTALLEAMRRGLMLAEVMAERDASSGMWAFGDAIRAAFVFVLMYALWPAGFNAVARLIRRLTHRGAAAAS